MVDDLTGNDVRISTRAIADIGHDATKNGRISKDAKVRIAYQEEQRIREKLRLAELVAEQAGRKTVKESDVITVEEILNSRLQP